jgi:hypothetical protein
MRITFKTFWCEHCQAEIPFRKTASRIVQAQADHLFSEHGIDIYEERRPPPKEDPMSLPGERFVVTSISGYVITPDLHSLDTNGKKSTEWYVLDTAYNHEIVATFQSTRGHPGQAQADKHAALLNRAERRWLEKENG